MRASVRRVTARLREPFVTAGGEMTERELLLLTVQDGEGHAGHGEAAPLRAAPAEIEAALRDCLPVLAEHEAAQRQAALGQCAAAAALPEALAAVDLALWDLAGQRAGAPVWRLLGASRPPEVSVNATIASPDRLGAARLAAAARERGFRTVKVKVGLGDDAGRLAAVRAAAGTEMAIRLDANGAWTVEQARAALTALAPVGIQLCEEPVHGLDQIAALRVDCPVPIAIDESASEPGALDRRVCDAVCLKVASCGGISGLLEAWRTARSAGYDVYLASSLDGPLGIAAALHAAALIRPELACGLATLGMFAAGDPLAPRSGAMIPSPGSGLGQGLAEWY